MGEALAVQSSDAQAQAVMRAPILMPALVETAFDYKIPAGTKPGTLVEATLAGKKRIGAVWDGAPDLSVPDAKIRPVTRLIDLPLLKESFRRWIDWVSDYTLAPKGVVLALCGLNHAVKTTRTPYTMPQFNPALSTLSEAQSAAANQLLNPDSLTPVLLDGVTGSGKTEVYFQAIAETLGRGKQVLVLLPEIALTHQWLARFEKSFGGKPAIWHSQTTPASRTKTWQAVSRGEAKLVVGARSALFLPYADLGLIVVDEEQDPSYKQEEGVLYHARDMAVVRAHFEKIPIILVSATPSLETLINVEEGKYRALHLPERFGAAGLPAVRLIDMTAHPPERGDFLSPALKSEMLTTLARGEQVLLFLNRRGYAPLLLCRACGHRFECADCSAWLVVHGKNARLECHHCGHREKMPETCPVCAATHEKLAACGPGVERIREEVDAMFSGESKPRIVTLSSDEAVNAETWSVIERGEVDIIIGTQMVAKGHHFPNLTLVGVIDADIGLSGADLRSAERTYQLLHQLGGRAGRETSAGTVLIQTYLPSHPVMQALARHDRDGMMALEQQMRQQGNWPPYGQLAAILLDGKNESEVRRAGQALARVAPSDPRIRVLGPAPAPLSKLRGQYRYRLLVKMAPGIHLQRTLRAWLKDKKFASVRIKTDVNPYYFQ